MEYRLAFDVSVWRRGSGTPTAVWLREDQARPRREIPRKIPVRLLREFELQDQQQSRMAGNGRGHTLAQHLHVRGGHDARSGPSVNRGIQFTTKQEPFQWDNAQLRGIQQAHSEHLLSTFREGRLSQRSRLDHTESHRPLL